MAVEGYTLDKATAGGNPSDWKEWAVGEGLGGGTAVA